MVSVNCEENKQTCKQVGLSGFPKLKLMGVVKNEQGAYSAIVVRHVLANSKTLEVS